MPVLKNTKHEAFAQHVAKGKPASNAYELAGYTTQGNGSEAAASRLLRNVKVAVRIKELQSKAAERAIVTIEDIARQLDEDREFARQCGSASASVAATMGKAKVLGLVTDKTESKTELSVDNSIAALMAEINGLTRSK